MAYCTNLASQIRRRIAKHFWDGNLYWKPQNQLVFPPSEFGRSEFIPFTAPYLCAAVPYDNLGFWDFPERMGWMIHRYDRQCHSGNCPPGVCLIVSENPGIPPISNEQRPNYGLQTPAVSRIDGSTASVAGKVAFLQAWLFFGALAEVCSLCRLELDLDATFILGDSVETGALNGLPTRLFVACQRRGLAGMREIRVRLYAIIRQVQLMISRAGAWEDEHEYTFAECQVLCTLDVLLRVLSLSFLCHSRHWNLDPNDDLKISTIDDPAYGWKPEGRTRMRQLTWSILVERGWCKSELHLLHGDDVFVFASFLERPAAPRNHGSCTETRCDAYQTNENDYKTVHTHAGCKCESVSVDSEQLSDALAAGKIPKIKISDNLQLSVVAEDSLPYVAISHVWADGLGNPSENGLPVCQVKRLRNLVTDLCNIHPIVTGGFSGRSVALWMDTLCIPVAAHLKEFRKLAIRSLERTFYEASATLVLDRELCLVPAQKTSNFELGIRIMCSGWMKRLWTLQEAALAVHPKNNRGKMYFQTGDGPVSWNRLSKTFDHKPFKPRIIPAKPDALTMTIQDVRVGLTFEFWAIVSMADRLPSIVELQKPGPETQFQKVCRAVQTRSTSRAEDEPICLASLVGLDVREILEVQTAAERMIRFYLLLREIPTAIIFAQMQRGSEGPGSENFMGSPFRWAPRSLLSLAEPMNVDLAIGAQRFSEAGHLTYGICETDGLHVEQDGFIFHEVTLGQRFIYFEETNTTKKCCLTWYGSLPENLGRRRPNMALIFETDMCSNVAIVCIEDRHRDGDSTEFYVTIVGHGNVRMQDPPLDGDWDIAQGVSTGLHQKWCLT